MKEMAQKKAEAVAAEQPRIRSGQWLRKRDALSCVRWPGLVLLLGGLVGALLTGCETGRTNKAHASWQHLSDDTTTSKPESTQALGPGEHQPPVPGSPTAAGADGNQPSDDMEARPRHGNEYGEAAAPHAQPAARLDRH